MENKRTFEEGISIFQRIERLAKLLAVVVGVSLLLSQLKDFDSQDAPVYQVMLIMLGIVATVIGVLSFLYTKQERSVDYLISTEIRQLPDSEETYENLFHKGEFDSDKIRSINNLYELAQIYIVANSSNVIVKKLCIAQAMNLTGGDIGKFEEVLENINKTLEKDL